MSDAPAALDEQLTATRDQLTAVRRAAVELSRDYHRLVVERLAVDTLGAPLTREEAVVHARDGIDGFIGALALADDAASIAQSYTTRLRKA